MPQYDSCTEDVACLEMSYRPAHVATAWMARVSGPNGKVLPLTHGGRRWAVTDPSTCDDDVALHETMDWKILRTEEGVSWIRL